ncbi:hypothetical protein GGR50DRAFT_647403 [Xylaria sp. CBS 124048]|nr:hypothetical protein GGR50DRAFT_647403 [Xylaria sp. CBS 124048]
MVLSRPNLSHAATMPLPTEVPSQASAAPTEPAAPQRSRLEIALVGTGKKKKKEIDMNLAYGSIPPDLADRVDLDPVSVSVGVGTGASTGAGDSGDKEETARTLVEKIEDLLTEAQCVHHTATHIIEHLQSKPEAAAAVALALAELSTLLGKMSPSFLGVIKGGSPAIFALLASPQFLIAAGLTVGVTVVMFGGWKIIKRIQEAKEIEAANRAAPLVFEAQQQPAPAVQSPYPASEVSGSVDEALVVEEELSTIETWRRGITPFGEDQSADLELISPEADRAIRSQYGDDDTESVRTSRTQRSSKSHKSHKSHRSRKDGEKGHERKSSRLQKEVDDTASEASSHRSHRSHTSSRSHHSHRSEKTERSSKPKRSSRTEIKAIEDGSRDKENSMEAVLKPKKDNMLKTLFKKKKRVEEGEHGSSVLKVR